MYIHNSNLVYFFLQLEIENKYVDIHKRNIDLVGSQTFGLTANIFLENLWEDEFEINIMKIKK